MVQYGVQPDRQYGTLVGPSIPTNGSHPGEKTVGQVLVGSGPDGMLPPGALALNPVSGGIWWKKAREMRRDPTLGFLRDIIKAPILGADWTVTAKKPQYNDAVEMIEESLLPHRDQFLYDMCRGFFDFGWAPYEVVKAQHDDGSIFITKLKGLLPDLTTILVDYYGALVGLRNTALHNVLNPNPVYLFRGDFINISRDVEGTNWYGEPIMRRCERPYDSWRDCDDAARRFDVKVAGACWVLYYPVGQTMYNGEMTDNAVIAQAILDALYASGKVAIPMELARFTDELNSLDPARLPWKVELISAQTQQSQFVDRAKYLDSLKARGMGVPERAIFEGQFGTKAEAEAHADFAIDNIEMLHRRGLTQLNQQLVDFLLEVNCEPDYIGQVKVEATPLSDAKRAMLRQLFMQHFSNPDGQALRADTINWDAIQDELGIPQVQKHPGQDTALPAPDAGAGPVQRSIRSRYEERQRARAPAPHG
jgi:hypothetical protein